MGRREQNKAFRVDCGRAFMGVYIWQDLPIFYTLNICSLLYVNYISLKPSGEGKRRRTRSLVFSDSQLLTSPSKTLAKVPIYGNIFSNMEILTGNSRSHRVFQGLYTFLKIDG